MRDRTAADQRSMRINPIRCEGVGICAHLAPDVITLDPWGFPLLLEGPLDEAATAQARRAATGCPRRALIIDGPTS